MFVSSTTRMLWSIRSNPFVKSVNNIRAPQFPESVASWTACKRYTRASVVEWPSLAYCRGSRLSATWFSSRTLMKPSIIFAKVLVRDIGLRSFSIF